VDSRSDEQLLADHLHGAAGAFDCLVARYTQELFVFLCRFVADNNAAEDLLQETFVQVHLAANTFDPARSFRPWIYTIAANKARDHLRSRGRRPLFSIDSTAGDEESSTLSQTIPAEHTPLLEQAEADERQAAVRKLIDRMPEHLRLMLMLGYFQQLPYAEIAEILQVPVGTVKSRLHAAVQHFAKLWRQYTEVGSLGEP
jgi:RNA polymerase sigma-70 factor, ECF subfamily